MASPLASPPQQLDPLDADYRSLYGDEDFTGANILRRGLDAGTLAEELADRRLSSQIQSFTQNGGALPSKEEQKAARAHLQTDYLSRINTRLTAERQNNVRARPENKEVGIVGGGLRIIGRAGLELVGGFVELGTGLNDIARSQLGLEDLSQDSDRFSVALLSGIKDARQTLQTPGSARVQQEMQRLNDDFASRDDDTFLDRTAATLSLLASADGASYALDQIASGAALIIGAGKAVGAVRAVSRITAGAAVRVAPTLAAGRTLSAATGATAGSLRVNAAVGSGVVLGARAGNEARDTINKLGDEIYALPDFVRYVDTMELAQDRELDDSEARSMYAEHVRARAQIIGGVASAALTYIAPATESAFLRLATPKAARTPLTAGTALRTGGIEAVAEGAEEGFQAATTSLATRGLDDAAGLDFESEQIEQGALVGAILGGATGTAIGAASPAPERQTPLTAEQAEVIPDTDPRIAADRTERDAALLADEGLEIPDATELQARRTLIEQKDRLRQEIGFAPSDRLTRLYNVDSPTPEQSAELSALETEERGQASQFRTPSGQFMQSPIVVGDQTTSSMTNEEAAAARDLRAGRISAQEFFRALGGTDQRRLVELADVALSPVGHIEDVRASFDMAAPGTTVDAGPVTMEATADALRMGFEAAQITKQVTLAEVSGREVPDGAMFGRGETHASPHPVAEFDVYYSDPTGVAYAVDPATGAVEVKPEGEAPWRSLADSTPAEAERAVQAMAVAAIDAGDRLSDTTLAGLVEPSRPERLEAVRDDLALRAFDLSGAQAEFVQAKGAAFSDATQARAATESARAEYLNSQQARELWENSIVPAEGIALPPDNAELTVENAVEYARFTRDRVAAEADRLGAVFAADTPRARAGALRSYIASRGLLTADNNPLSATGSPRINAIIRAATATRTTPAERVRVANQVLDGSLDSLPGAGGRGEVSFTDPDFGPAEVAQVRRFAEELREMSIREARFARLSGRMERFADGDAALFDTATLQPNVVARGLSPLADNDQAAQAVRALAEAVVQTPGASPLATTLPVPREIASQELSADIALDATPSTPAELADLISQIDATPDGALKSGSLGPVRSAARALQREHARAPSAPVVGALKGLDARMAIQTTLNRVAAMTGDGLGSVSAAYEFSPTVGPTEGVTASQVEMIATMTTAGRESEKASAIAALAPARDGSGTLDAAMSEQLLFNAKAVAPSMTNAEMTQLVEQVVTDSPSEFTQRMDAALAAAASFDAELAARVRAVRGERGDFKLGERVDNPMDRGQMESVVQERRDAYEALGIKFVTFDSLEHYQRVALEDARQPGLSPEAQDAIEKEVLRTPSFSARWQQARHGDRGGVVQLVANTFENAEQLDRAMMHELVAHYRLADLLGANGYERMRSMVLGARKRTDPALYAARERVVDTLTDGVMDGYNGDRTRAQVRARLISTEPDLIANETLADLAEGNPSVRSDTVFGRIGDMMGAAGLGRRGVSTAWVRKMLEVSRDSLDVTASGRIRANTRINRLRAGLEATDFEGDAPSTDAVKERGLLGAYRTVVNSEVHFQTIEQVARSAYTDSPQAGAAWRDLRIANETANSKSNARHRVNLKNYKDVLRAVSTMRDRAKVDLAQFDDALTDYLNARDAIDRHTYIVLAKMPVDNASFNERRAAILSAARNAERVTDPAVVDMIPRLRRAAREEGATEVNAALQPDSPTWEALVGATRAEIDAQVSGPAGAPIAKLIADTETDPVSFDAALDALRGSIMDNQVESGTYGTRGRNMAAASGIRHYIPQLGRDPEGQADSLRKLFRANDPRYKALSKLEQQAMYESQAGVVPDATLFNADTPFARSAFNVALQGRSTLPTVSPLKAFERRAYTAAYEVGTADVNRSLVRAVQQTQLADVTQPNASNLAGVGTVERNIDLQTPEAQAAFAGKLAQGDYIVANNTRGEPTLVKINSPQLLEAVTDRFVTQAVTEAGLIARNVGPLTRFYGRSLTSWNPMFVTFKQFPRDLWEAAVVSGFEQKLGVRGARDVVVNSMRNTKRLGKFYFGDEATQVELLNEYRAMKPGTWQREFSRFIDGGGEQTFTQQFNDPTENPALDDPGVVRQALTGAARTVQNVTGIDVARTRGGQSRSSEAGRRLEGYTNLFDNAVRFELFQQVKAKAKRDGSREGDATNTGIDVARNLMPFNRRSAVSRKLSPYFVFANSATASLSALVERRIWRDGQPPLETVQLANGQSEVRLAEGWARQLNAPMLGAVAAKGMVMTLMATSMMGGDDEEDVPLQDVVSSGRFMDGIVFPGGIGVAGKRGEALPGFFPEQLGITGMAHATGAAIALLISGYEASDVMLSYTNAVAKNLTPLNVTLDPDRNGVGAIVKGLTPTIFGAFTNFGYDENTFGGRITDLGGTVSIDNLRPSTGSNFGLIEALRQLDDATGFEVDPGQMEYVIRQFGVFGQVALSTLDNIGRAVSNEPTQFMQSVGRATGTHVNGAQYGATRGYYRYKGEYLDPLASQFKALRRDDELAGDTAPGSSIPFKKSSLKKMGPRARAWASQLPDEFWMAKTEVGRVARAVGVIKAEVDVLRSTGRGEEVLALRLEEDALYRDALRMMRVAFDDGYDYEGLD